ncbi:MAG: carboxyl-terminal protease, partial [Pedobacter sp.]|nr:carboxyl-terminal protease [Chitinophagaceae bacterium]
VQQQFQLSDGGAVRLTIARYYTPLGRSVQKPYVNKSKHDYEAELFNRFQDGEVVKEDSSLLIGKAYKTPKGHTVFGGGGITPDIFVPYDTSKLPKALLKMYYKNTLSNFVYQYYINNKTRFASLPSANAFEKQFNATETEWQALGNYVAKDSILLNEIDAKSKTDLLLRMKALMARQLFRSEGYYEVLNSKDAIIKKALGVLNKL